MKYQVGDLVFLKSHDYKPRQEPNVRVESLPNSRRLLPLNLDNTFGIITKVYKHNYIFKKHSTQKDNAYTWFSQVNEKEYYMYEDEFNGEIIK